jgi:hypothetical protein
MNYYLWTAGKEHGPYTLEQVKEAVLEGTVTIQQTARRADSHDWVSLGTIVDLPQPPGETALVIPETLPMPTKRDVKEYLEHIRDNSCYGVLRSIIEVFTAVAIVAALFAIGIGIFHLVGRETEMGLYCLGYGIGGFILIIGIRQSALLLIDIADTLLHEHSKTAVGQSQIAD